MSMMVIRAGWGNTANALLELADVGVTEEFKTSIRRAAEKALADNSSEGKQVEVQDVQGVKAGQNYLVNVELVVPGDWPVNRTRLIEDMVRERVGSKVRGVRRVRIRFVAKSDKTPDFSDEFIGAEVSPRSSPEPDAQSQSYEDVLPNGNGNVRKTI